MGSSTVCRIVLHTTPVYPQQMYNRIKNVHKKNKTMETKNIYDIKIDDINSEWVNYRLWKNGEDIEPDDLTVEEMIIFQKELLDFAEMFNDEIKSFLI